MQALVRRSLIAPPIMLMLITGCDSMHPVTSIARLASVRVIAHDSASGRPIANFVAYLAKDSLSSSARLFAAGLSDANGEVALEHVTPGVYFVVARRIGYATQISRVDLRDGGAVRLEFVLAPPSNCWKVTAFVVHCM